MRAAIWFTDSTLSAITVAVTIIESEWPTLRLSLTEKPPHSESDGVGMLLQRRLIAR